MPGLRPHAYHLAAAVLAALGGSAPATAAVHDVHTHRFDNGLTLHVATGHAAPVAAVQAWVGVGAADEATDEAGLAHLVEHMLFKGSAGYATGELVRAIEHGGGELNAWTALDHTVYHAVLASAHVDVAVHALGDALVDPRLERHELAREREVVLEEIRQGSDDPARGVAQCLFSTAFVHHPYRRPVIGTAAQLARVDDRGVLAFFRRHYVADNLTLVVTGDVDPARVQRSVGRRFAAMPTGRPARARPLEPAQAAPRITWAEREVGEAYVAVGFHVPPLRHPDAAALDVAALLLGQNESARLPRALRDRAGLATSAHASLHALRDPGLLVLSATGPRRAADTLVGRLAGEAVALATEVTADELERARIAAEAAYAEQQMKDIKSGARNNGQTAAMKGVMHLVNDEEIKAIAEYVSKLK